MTDSAAATTDTANFVCTKADILDALRLNQTLSLKGRRFLITLSGVACVLVIIPPVIQRNLSPDAMTLGVILAAFYIVVVAARIAIGRWISLPRVARLEFSQRRTLDEAMTVAVNPPYISLTTKNGFSNTPTADFHKWAEDKRFILLYHSDRLFNPIPKRVLSENFIQRLVAELAREGVPKACFSNS